MEKKNTKNYVGKKITTKGCKLNSFNISTVPVNLYF